VAWWRQNSAFIFSKKKKPTASFLDVARTHVRNSCLSFGTAHTHTRLKKKNDIPERLVARKDTSRIAVSLLALTFVVIAAYISV
jgi:hypothetical protein